MRHLSAVLVGMAVVFGLPACAAWPAAAGQTARTDLQRAQDAVRARDAQAAIAALDGAEQAWLSATAAQPNPVVFHDRPGLRSIGMARMAVRQGLWDSAARSIGSALHDMAGAGAAG